jgi:hypothetical protein
MAEVAVRAEMAGTEHRDRPARLAGTAKMEARQAAAGRAVTVVKVERSLCNAGTQVAPSSRCLQQAALEEVQAMPASPVGAEPQANSKADGVKILAAVATLRSRIYSGYPDPLHTRAKLDMFLLREARAQMVQVVRPLQMRTRPDY